MKICDKIREIYRLYQEYYRLLSRHDTILRDIDTELDNYVSKVMDTLAVAYFGGQLGIVISCYCYNNIFINPISEEWTVQLVIEKTREVAKWYQDNYDEKIDVEEVVRELKKKLEREEELERRTEMLERFYDSGGYKSVGNVSSGEIIVGLEKMMEEAEAIWGR